jgi:hypothetical protein
MADREDNDSWGRVLAEAVLLALDCTRTAADAEDLAMEGLQLVLEGKAPWDPAISKRGTLASHVVAVGYNVMRNKQRAWNRRTRPAFLAKLGQTMDDGYSSTPEQRLSDAQERAHNERLFAELLSEAEQDDPDVGQILLLEQQEVDEPAKQARRLGWDIERVRNARKRLKRRVLALRERGESDEDD